MSDTDEGLSLGPLGAHLDNTVGEARGTPVEVTTIGQRRCISALPPTSARVRR